MASSGKRVMSDAASGSRWQEHCIEFSLEEIEAFTCDFNHAAFIAEGGFGKVYEGYIHSVSSEPDAAVKRLNKTSEQGKGEFEMEIKTLSQIHHPNLIKLIGYCRDKDEMVLVYEYMRNGTLADHLYKQSGTASSPLSWKVRLNICVGAARGLAHLHEEVEPNIIHRDIKATNILLDGNMEAKVADFGLSKFMSESQSHVSTDVKGTPGFLDPAYYNSRWLTKKSDVYALGVVFLQVLCGRPALDNTLVPEQRLLSYWVQSCFDKGDIDEMVDPSLKGQISPDGLRMFIELALKCLVRLPEERPDMIQVVQKLDYVLEIEAQFTPPVGIVRDRAFTRCSRLPADAQLHPPTVMEENAASKPIAGIGKDPDQLEQGNEYGETSVHPPLQDLELQEGLPKNTTLLRVQALHKRGEVVAVTGDGTNDAPALHEDPCRPGVKDAVRLCTEAGVKVRMVTGDNIQRARAIALECGILSPGADTSEPNVIEGKAFRQLSEKDGEQVAMKISVMGRSSPNDKLLLVQALRKRGEVVAVTGDGTNDAPALHEADIGLSMGISGTEVAKESSDITILDDNFASVVNVVRWGRSGYANIQKFIQFQLTVNVAALVINVVAAITAGDVPLNAVQLLWVNLIMDTLGVLALATEPPTDSLMCRSPVGRREPLITNIMWRNLLVQALYQVTVLLVLNFHGKKILNLDPNNSEHANKLKNTLIFNTFVMCQIFNGFNAREPEHFNVFKGITKNRLFVGIVGTTFVLQILIIMFLGHFFSIVRLKFTLWILSLAIALVSWPLAVVGKMIPVPKTPFAETFMKPYQRCIASRAAQTDQTTKYQQCIDLDDGLS